MRVALVTDGIWPYVLGGMQKHSYYLCKYLAQNKVYVDLFHFNKSSYDISRLDVFTDKEKKFIRSHIVSMPRSLRFPGHYLYNSYRHSRLIFKSISPLLHEFDLIITKGFAGWYLIDQKKNHQLKAPPIAVKFHGYEMFQKPPDFKTKLQHHFILRKPVRSISQNADIVLSYGGKISDIVRSLGVREEQIFELPSGVEESSIAESIKPVQKKIKFLYLGRYERRKGIEELNRAIKQIIVKDKNLALEFSFIGPIPKSKQINGKQINYYGEIRNRQKLNELMAQNDVLICPSWSEGMPNVILEAMASGLAVIATDVGATNVLVSHETGWLMKSSDPEEIEKTIREVLDSDTELINSKKRKALELIRQRFTWEKLMKQFIDKFSMLKA